MLLKYYGVDWLIFLLLLFHLWFLGEKRRYAFLFGAAAAVCGIVFGFLVESVGMMCMNTVLCCMHLMAYKKWNKA